MKQFRIGDKVVEPIMNRQGCVADVTAEYILVDYRHIGLRRVKIEIAESLIILQPFTPEVMEEFAAQFTACGGRIELCCGPQHVEKMTDDVSSASKLTPTEVLDYIHVVTEKSQGAKWVILVNEKFPVELAKKIGVKVWTDGDGKVRGKRGEYQLNSKPLAEYVMKHRDVLPVKQIN